MEPPPPPLPPGTTLSVEEEEERGKKTAMEPPPPLLPPGTTLSVEEVGSGRYTIVTDDLEVAASWVRNLPLLELDPPVKRVIGFSFVPHPDFATYSATFSFFSRVLVLRLAPPTGDGAFPQDLRTFLVNPCNIFVGAGIRQASMMMEEGYGVGRQIKLELDPSDEFSDYSTGQPHLVLAQRNLRWIWPITSGFPKIDVQISVLSQLLGHHRFGNPPWN